MRTTSPHRKRRAATGRLDNATVVAHGFINVSSTSGDKYSCDRVAVRQGTSVKAADVIKITGTEHRNRFGADHKVSIVAPNVAQVRRTVDLALRTLKSVKVDQTIGEYGMINIKVISGASELISFINQSRSDRLFRVETAFCNDRDSMCATTMRRTHAPTYRK